MQVSFVHHSTAVFINPICVRSTSSWRALEASPEFTQEITVYLSSVVVGLCGEMGTLRGLLLDESLLFAEDEGGNTHLHPGAAGLLKRLRYSKLRVGICYQEDVSSQKMTFLTNTAMAYSFECIPWSALCMDDTLNGLLLSWSNDEGFCIYATSRTDEELFVRLQNQGWKIILKSSEVGSRENKHILFIDKLEEFFLALCRSIKMTMHDFSVTVIGYVMKSSREEDFAKRGAFPMHPTQNGIIFVPLFFELPLEYQLQEVDAVLHKATDEIVSIEPSTLDFPKGITYSKGMQELERCIQEHPEFCIIDPLYNIYPLLDRVRIQELLLGLEDLNLRNHCRIRAPNFLKIDNFHEPNLRERLLEAKLSFPYIVKPLVACGVPDAHNMALVFKMEDFRNLFVPLPAIIQEYVDHGSVIFKIYVLGERVFHAVKKSMPNAGVLLSSSERNGFAPIVFDSLKSLPTANVNHPSMGVSKASEQSLDMGLVNNAANWLRRQLDLTIFGFDVVIQEGSGDHIIVDVNYLPSFKEVPDDEAIPAFWDAIKNSYQSKKKPK